MCFCNIWFLIRETTLQVSIHVTESFFFFLVFKADLKIIKLNGKNEHLEKKVTEASEQKATHIKTHCRYILITIYKVLWQLSESQWSVPLSLMGDTSEGQGFIRALELQGVWQGE